MKLRFGSVWALLACLMFAVACDADRALEDIPEDFLIQAEAALDGGGVVELESNVLKGTVRLTNTNPQVLALLATDPWRNGSAAVTATSTTPAGFTSRTNSFVLVNPSEYRFEMLVEAGAGGEQGVVYNLSAARGGYVFPSLSGVTVRPVATQPAPADVTVESCIGVVQFEFGTDATCQTPAAVFAPTVDGLSLYKSSTGHYTGYITGGTARAASLVITFNTPTGQLQTVQPVQLAAGCDEIVRTCLSGLPPPPPPLGSATGAFEIHGEEVSSKQLPIIGTGGRLHLLPGPWSPVSHPERWWFVPDLHVGNYLVDARVYLRSGRSFTLFDAPGWGELSIEEGQTTVLTKQVGGATRHAFDMHPAYFHGSIRLVDPFVPLHPGAWSSLQALYFEADHDADGDGAPDDIEIGSRGTYLSAGGLNGYSRTAFPGAFDAARGELVSTYEQVLAAPYDLPQAWSQDRLYLRFWSEPTGSGPFTTRPGLYDPERYRYGALWLRATSGFATTLQPEQRFRVDHEYCFSEVQVQYATSQGRIFNPWAEVSGSFSGRDWRDQQVSYVAAGNFLGTPAAVNTPNPNAYAQPSGQVSLTLPQGSFTLKPGASLVTETGAVNTANFAPLGVTVGCGQRLKLVPPLAVSVSSSQGCATSSSTPVTGRVKSLPAEVDRIWYRLNGGPEVTLCTNCGIDPTFSTNVTLQACDNALTVYAFSEGMSEPATATEQLVWDDPEDGPSCAGSFCVNRPPVARCKGVVVSADSACSGCGSVDDGSYDPDTGDSVHCVQTPACPHPLGSHTATLTCTDSSGLTSSCEAKVTVRDTQPPTLTCPAPLVVERTGPEGATVTPGVATASDACAPPQVSGPAAGTYPVGTTSVTYTATDVGGNQAQCVSTIQVLDSQLPEPPGLTMCNLPRYTRETNLMACGWATPVPDGAPVSQAYFRVDGGPPLPVTPDLSGGFVITWLGLTEGTHVVELFATDTWGAVSRRQMTVTVDLTPPVLAILAPLADELLGSPVVTVTSSVQDATPVRVMTQWLQTGTVDSGTGTVTHTVDLVNRGHVPLLVSATDAAGNHTQLVTQVFIQSAPVSPPLRLSSVDTR